MNKIISWILGSLREMHFHAKLLSQMTLMAAVMPALGWGPFAHPHINRRALEEAERRAGEGDDSVNRETLDLIRRHRDTFTFAANSADAISNHHVIHDLPIYDYTHNYIPDENTEGEPVFGCALVDTWLRHRGSFPEEDAAVAYGWLAHQLADWYPHYAHIDNEGNLAQDERTRADQIGTFSGYADSHPVLGPDFFSPVLAEQRLFNHALIELFYDILILERAGADSYLDRNHVELFSAEGGTSLITECAKRFGHRRCVVPPEHVGPLKKDFDFVIDGMRILIELMKKVRPDLPAMLQARDIEPITHGWDFIDRSVSKVVERVFCTTNERMGELAEAGLGEADASDVAAGLRLEVTRKPTTLGSVFFEFARKLGMTTAFSVLKPMLIDPAGLRLKTKLLGFIPLQLDLSNWLISELSRAAGARLLRGESKPDPVQDFLSALLLDKRADLGKAVNRFRQAAKPVIAFGDPLEAKPPTKREVEYMVKEMLSKQKLQVCIYPASGFRDERLRKSKAIDDRSLLFRLNGYPITDPIFRDLLEPDIHFQRGNSECELVVECNLKRPLQEAEHHLFIDARDRSGIWARNQDLLIRVGG